MIYLQGLIAGTWVGGCRSVGRLWGAGGLDLPPGVNRRHTGAGGCEGSVDRAGSVSAGHRGDMAGEAWEVGDDAVSSGHRGDASGEVGSDAAFEEGGGNVAIEVPSGVAVPMEGRSGAAMEGGGGVAVEARSGVAMDIRAGVAAMDASGFDGGQVLVHVLPSPRAASKPMGVVVVVVRPCWASRPAGLEDRGVVFAGGFDGRLPGQQVLQGPIEDQANDEDVYGAQDELGRLAGEVLGVVARLGAGLASRTHLAVADVAVAGNARAAPAMEQAPLAGVSTSAVWDGGRRVVGHYERRFIV